jgi:hypothetical protein
MKKKRVERKNDDPLSIYGYGISAYLNIIWVLFLLFTVLSLITIPVLQIYKSGNGFNPEILSTKFGQYSLGNLGYSSIQCASVPLDV